MKLPQCLPSSKLKITVKTIPHVKNKQKKKPLPQMKRRRTELTDSLMGPKISSTLPIWVLLCRYIGALKKGIFSFVSFVTASPSHAWTNDETSAHAPKKKTPLRYLLLKLHYFNKTQTITLKPNRPTTSEGGPSSRKPPPPPRPPKRPPLKPPPRPPSRPPLKPPPPRPRPPPLGGLMVQWLSRESE